MLDVKFLFDDQHVEAQFPNLLALLDFDRQFVGPRLVLEIDPEQAHIARRPSRPGMREKWNRPREEGSANLRRLVVTRNLDHEHLPLLAAVLPVDAFRLNRCIREELNGKYTGQQHNSCDERSVDLRDAQAGLFDRWNDHR